MGVREADKFERIKSCRMKAIVILLFLPVIVKYRPVIPFHIYRVEIYLQPNIPTLFIVCPYYLYHRRIAQVKKDRSDRLQRKEESPSILLGYSSMNSTFVRLIIYSLRDCKKSDEICKVCMHIFCHDVLSYTQRSACVSPAETLLTKVSTNLFSSFPLARINIYLEDKHKEPNAKAKSKRAASKKFLTRLCIAYYRIEQIFHRKQSEESNVLPKGNSNDHDAFRHVRYLSNCQLFSRFIVAE